MRASPWLLAVAALAGGGTAADAGDPANPAPSPAAVAIAPDLPSVPANHLKFYLQFSTPMARGEVFRHLRLVEIDPAGTELAEVPEPFREVELWDETFTRLTLWFHPGRQKPGVNLNVELGPILEPGGRYRLEVSGAWRDESGARPFPQGFAHIFTAGPADESSPDPGTWKIRVPDHRRVDVVTGEALDPVSLANRVTVDETTFFRVESRADGFSLVFSEPLPPGGHRLVIDPRLEDLAGNSVARPFNLDLGKHPGFNERTEPVILPFTIPAAP